MAHEEVLTFFVIVTALAFVVQVWILLAAYRALSELSQAVSRLQVGIELHVNPLMRSFNSVLEAAREPLAVILANLSETSGILRERAASADLVLADGLERVRALVNRLDQLVSEVLAKIDATTDAIQRGVLGPVREASAVIAGVRRALEVLRSRRRVAPGERTHQEEQLFI